VPARTRRDGFTLLELLAVVAILALFAAMIRPTVSATRRLHDAADRIAADLELARQRSVMTGTPHRLWLHLDAGRYRLEWHVTQARALDLDEEAVVDAPADPYAEAELDLSAPRAAERSYHPLSSVFGRDTTLPDDVFFEAVETEVHRIAHGEVTVAFAPDGTTEATRILLADGEGSLLEIEVRPLADAVRVLDVR